MVASISRNTITEGKIGAKSVGIARKIGTLMNLVHQRIGGHGGISKFRN
jgi:hypothetical protein